MAATSVCRMNRHAQRVVILLILVAIQSTLARRELDMRLSLPQGISFLETQKPESPIGFITIDKYTDSTAAEEVNCFGNSSAILVTPLSERAFGVFRLVVPEGGLDRETIETETVEIKCQDGEVPPVTVSKVLKFTILDANDNAPEFRFDTLQASVSENIAADASILRVVAYDEDEGINAEITYSIPKSNVSDPNEKPHSEYFRIDAETGELFTTAELNREITPILEFDVQATDKGEPALFSTGRVKISVLDVNDNEPVLNTTKIHVKENQPAKFHAATLEASDPDEGLNSEVTFALHEEIIHSKVDTIGSQVKKAAKKRPFTLRKNGKLYTTEVLDRETDKHYVLKVIVTDKGSPKLSSTGTLTVVVDDVNEKPVMTSECIETPDTYTGVNYDNNPEYKALALTMADSNSTGALESNNSSIAVVDWSYPDKDRIVYQAAATDVDHGRNGQLVYSIAPTVEKHGGTGEQEKDPLFKIDSETGQVFLNRNFRKTDSLQQIMNVSVSDMGKPPFQIYCGVSVTFDLNISDLQVRPIIENGSRPLTFGVVSLQFIVYALCLLGVLIVQTNLPGT